MKKFIWPDYYGIPLDQVLGSVAILIMAAIGIMYIVRFLRRLMMRHRQRLHVSYETVVFVARLVRVLLWIAIAFVLLGFWGVAVSGLWATLMSVAAVIGVGFLAVWTIVSNVTASLFLALWRPFHLGTTVEVLPENLKGEVIDKNMMFTILREEAGSELYVPNNMFFQKMFRVSGKNEVYPFETFRGGGEKKTGG